MVTERDFAPYGYPCDAHAHATPRARIRCQSPAEPDEIPDLAVKGMTYTYRGPT